MRWEKLYWCIGEYKEGGERDLYKLYHSTFPVDELLIQNRWRSSTISKLEFL
jgi:hypothetical protein